MSAFELNKFAGGFLAAALLACVVTAAGEFAYPDPEPVESPSFAAAPPPAGPGEEAAPAEAPLAERLAAADPARGGREAKKCAACHAFEAGAPGRLGPALYGIVGRAVGAEAGFRYSGAMAGRGGAWDYEALDAFLAAPKEWLPGTKMVFPGIADAQARADVVLWLRGLAEAPAPLPEP